MQTKLELWPAWKPNSWSVEVNRFKCICEHLADQRPLQKQDADYMVLGKYNQNKRKSLALDSCFWSFTKDKR